MLEKPWHICEVAIWFVVGFGGTCSFMFCAYLLLHFFSIAYFSILHGCVSLHCLLLSSASFCVFHPLTLQLVFSYLNLVSAKFDPLVWNAKERASSSVCPVQGVHVCLVNYRGREMHCWIRWAASHQDSTQAKGWDHRCSADMTDPIMTMLSLNEGFMSNARSPVDSCAICASLDQKL